VRKDGALLDVVLTASPLRDRAGEVVGASAVVHDITARKRDEAELRRSHAELERFADIAAHDLREPLMAITQLTALLERGVDSQREEIIAHLRAAARTARRLVDGLLDLARVGRGRPARGARRPAARRRRACSAPSPRRSRRPAPASRSARCPRARRRGRAGARPSRTCSPTR
jgi:signal transduction histidine kinase